MRKRIISLLILVSTVITMLGITAYAKAPGVKILAPSSVTETSAYLRGAVTSNSGIRIKEYGFGWTPVGASSLQWKVFKAGKDFSYPDPINNDVIKYKVTGLKPGTRYYYVFYAINENGEKGEAAYNFTTDKSGVAEPKDYNKDKQVPEIYPIASSAGSRFTAGTATEFSAMVIDNVALKKLYMYIDDDKVRSFSLSRSSSEISYTTDELSEGVHTVKVVAVDSSDNRSERTTKVTVTAAKDYEADRKAAEKPVITAFECVQGNTVKLTDNITVNAYVSGSNAIKYVEYYISGLGSIGRGDYFNGKYSMEINIPSTGWSEGNNEVRAVAVDVNGNKSEEKTITLYCVAENNESITEPESTDTRRPTVKSLRSSAGLRFKYGKSTTLKCSASDENLATVKLYIDNELKATSDTDTVKYKTSKTELSVGKHKVKIEAEDTYGNRKTKTYTITVR